MHAYIDAMEAPLRNTGAIKIYDEQAFEGMRRASLVTATCLDELSHLVKPGVTTQTLDDFVHEFGLAPRCSTSHSQLSWLYEVLLHINQSCGLSWHTK